MDKTIKIECQGAGTRNLDELTEFQGDLKSLSEENYLKLKREILTEGFAFPIHIWTDPQDAKTYIIGGHQRLRTLKKMRDEEGYEIPEIPVSIVHARDWKQAKRRVLQDVTQYGKVEKQGLYEFITHAEIDVDDLKDSFDIPQNSYDLDDFKSEFYDEIPPELPPEIEFTKELDEKNDYIVLMFNSKEDFKKACEKLAIKSEARNLSPTNHPEFVRMGIGRIIEGNRVISQL